MGLRCFFSGHKFQQYPPCQRIYKSADTMGDDIYLYHCICSRCGTVMFIVTDLIPFQLPWNSKTEYDHRTYKEATTVEVDNFLLNPRDRMTTGVFAP